MSRRRQSVLLAVVLLLAAYGYSLRHVFGTGHGGDRPTVVVRFVHWQLESGIREAFDRVARRYMELHPEVRVEQFAVPGNVYNQWLSTQLASNDVPDLVSFNSTEQARVAQLPRYFQEITRWVNEPNPYDEGTPLAGMPWCLTFIDGGRNRSTYIEQFRNYYAVGVCSHSMRIFYNRDLLVAITGKDEPPQNFQDWLELGRKVRAFRPGLVHVAGARDNTIWLMPTLVNQALAGWLLDHDHELRFSTTCFDLFGDMIDGKWNLRSPPAEDALRLMHAFGGEMTPGFLQLDRDSAMRAFLRGEAFSLPNGTWDYPTMRAQATFRIGAFRLPLPTADDPVYGGFGLRPISDGGLSTALPFYLTRQSKHPEAAIDFLRFITSVEGNRLFSQASHWMPSVEGVPIEPELLPFKPMHRGYMVTDAQNGPLVINGPGEEYTQLFLKNLHTLYAPDGGVDAYRRLLEPLALAAARTDLEKQVRVQRENIRERDLTLAALQFLDPDERAEAARQQSSQHLGEIQVYLMMEKLARSR